MQIRNEKGLTAIDIILSVIIITVFTTVIGGMIAKVNIETSEIEKKSVAISYAVQEIEKIKSNGISSYEGKGINEIDTYVNGEIIENMVSTDVNGETVENRVSTGYYKEITIEDYVHANNNEISDLLKEVTVKISYQANGETQTVSLSTYLTKE